MTMQALSVRSSIGYLAIVALIAALMPVAARAAAQAGSGTAVERESFSMWCLEIQLYPAARCDACRSRTIREAVGASRKSRSGVKARLSRDPLERRTN
jgi:hypothetical protein